MKPVDITVAITLALTLGALGGALLADAVRKPAPLARIYQPAPECRGVMNMPLDFDISVTQSGDGKAPITRYYKR